MLEGPQNIETYQELWVVQRTLLISGSFNIVGVYDSLDSIKRGFWELIWAEFSSPDIPQTTETELNRRVFIAAATEEVFYIARNFTLITDAILANKEYVEEIVRTFG